MRPAQAAGTSVASSSLRPLMMPQVLCYLFFQSALVKTLTVSVSSVIELKNLGKEQNVTRTLKLFIFDLFLTKDHTFNEQVTTGEITVFGGYST